MSNVARVAGQAANTLSKPLNVEDVFSTYLYEGNGSTQTITNGIDLDGEGGLVWIKNRDQADNHRLHDTVRGNPQNTLITNLTLAAFDQVNSVTGFNNNGFDIGSYSQVNTSGENFCSWTFRKAPKFFDVVTYTGTGSAQNISHNLGSVPGMIVVKRTDNTSDWNVYHRESHNFPANNFLRMNLTNAIDADFDIWNATVPTDAVFSVGSSTKTNVSGATYVAYLFAHNDGDGEFGDGTQDIIKCGSYTGNGSSQDIDLGFEPQWIMIKNATSAQNWWIVDNMRGIVSGGNDPALLANDSGAEITGNGVADLNPNGFKVYESLYNTSANNYIYIAIRRGPMAVPESGTEVFDITTRDATHPSFDASFDVVDAAINRNTSGAFDWFAYARLLGTKYLQPNLTNAENTGASIEWDYMDGWSNGSGTNADLYSWMWKRAPNFFDVVTYTGDGTAGRTVSHNLGVAPEMMWVKNRDQTQTWAVYHKDLDATSPEDYYLQLQTSNARINTSAVFGAQPTDSVFTVDVASSVNQSGQGIIAYLFASLDGVSKVGSYTGNGTTQNIDCGFTSGARFVLIKRTDSTGDWEVYDTERGINAGNDSHLQLNTTTAQFLSADTIDPYNAGFTVNVDGSDSRSNASGASYIFYAIA
jgi:hypothetical protein